MKHTFGKALLSLGAAAVIAAGSPTVATAQQELRFTTSVPANSFIYANILEVWAQRVTDDSEGTITVRMFPAGTLGRDASGHLDMLRNGIVDLAYFIPGYTPGAMTEATIVELPNVVPSATVGSLAATQMVDNGSWTGQGMEGVKILGMFSTAPTLLTTSEPVTSLEDVANMNLRGAGPTLLASIEALGATPVGGLTAPQIAEALSRGLLDGTINEWVALTIFGISQTAHNHLNVNMGASAIMVGMNRQTYDSLPAAAQAAIDRNSGEAFARLWGEEFDARIDAFRSAAEQDADRTFTTLSDEEQARWAERLQTVTDHWIESTPNGQALYDAYVAAIAAAE
ncbi:TRAP transporter substrate-binding protein [Pararhodobacter zhoushanensis]|uniref:TRAP transporter substrate-binding protein n=1 Tax=Pararhodobacter zhoushanensis TaxID=2479545 RepID=A0ABT3GU33_9RHOB|nr:TRAP transporter substrate-binding protein [Pararhodobacter zhoushanensis]MCW1931046.1 TRAP transporter substrate-binding protein [Pararhodobacter zhoushanensis]